jgi:hypothetical protein
MKFLPFLAALILLSILGIVGKMDLLDAAREHLDYCEAVESHVWPDFKGLQAKGECSEKVLRDVRKIFAK